MDVVCPSCHNRIELAANPPAEVFCPCCGSRFRLCQGTTTAHEAPPGPGKLGRFELLAAVGSGAFGTVYKARDTDLDRVVAVKVPRDNRVGGAELNRFLREARSAAQLRH